MKPFDPPQSPEAVARVEVDSDALDASVVQFAGPRGGRYARVFRRIQGDAGWGALSFNWAAALLGPFWSAARGLWGLFWAFLLLEVLAWTQIGRGWWGNPGAAIAERAAQQQARADQFAERAEAARAAGQDPGRFEQLGANIARAARESLAQAEAASADAAAILLAGLGLLAAVKLAQGALGDPLYERQYTRWRVAPQAVEHGLTWRRAAVGALLVLAIAPLTVYRFTITSPPKALIVFPEAEVSSALLPGEGGTLYSHAATWLERRIDAAASAGGEVFDAVTDVVRAVLDMLAVALIGTPWPVVMLVIVVTAWRAAGPRVAVFTAAALAYIALLGFWAVAMETVALVGAAVAICVVIGIPLGIWFGASRRAHALAEPVLDLMQTLPAFVYLIPIIAFFGTGNPPGILATIVFGMPPVIRLTALGMRGVPGDIKEAATAFGASRWRLLRDVELPLALPSIMAGVNQTILMCLSMVVIISLIGGGGLGKVILEALQFAAKGPGLLGGFAILFCAMVIDRIVQGAFRRR